MDDVFCIMKNQDDADLVFKYLNERHHNIKFNMEKERYEKLAFLDLSLSRESSKLNTSVFPK